MLWDDDGAGLLHQLGVCGPKSELIQASQAFGGHALALYLLGTLLVEYYEDGDVKHYKDIADYEDRDFKLGRHARKVMDAYVTWLGEGAEVCLLELLGLFDRPAEKEGLAVLLGDVDLKPLTRAYGDLPEVKKTRLHKRLIRLGLLQGVSDRDGYEAHPLVREHFGARLEARDGATFRKAHSVLYEYYRDKSDVPYQPDDLDVMEPLFRAVHHGCRAWREQEVVEEVYWPRIRRGYEHFINRKLGAYGSNLSALANFFERPFQHVSSRLSDDAKAGVLSWAAFALRALGRSPEAIQPMEAAVNLVAAQGNWEYASINAGNLSELCLLLGDLDGASTWAKKAVGYADQSQELAQRIIKRTGLADVYHQQGDLERARALFEEAEALQKEREPDLPQLYSLQGYRYCDLLLSLGEWAEVAQRASYGLEVSTRNGWLLIIAMDQLMLARVAHASQQQDANADPQEIRQKFDSAVSALRKAGSMDQVPRGLIARARFLHDMS